MLQLNVALTLPWLHLGLEKAATPRATSELRDLLEAWRDARAITAWQTFVKVPQPRGSWPALLVGAAIKLKLMGLAVETLLGGLAWWGLPSRA